MNSFCCKWKAQHCAPYLFIVFFLNTSRAVHFRKLYLNKIQLKFLFLHFFLAPLKVLRRLVRQHKEV